MKRFRSLFQWGSLYIMVVIFMGMFFWEEKLQLSLSEHKLLEIGILLFFCFFTILWVNQHETNFLETQYYEPPLKNKQREPYPLKMSNPDKRQ